jgi:hypothetical protein
MVRQGLVRQGRVSGRQKHCTAENAEKKEKDMNHFDLSHGADGSGDFHGQAMIR